MKKIVILFISIIMSIVSVLAQEIIEKEYEIDNYNKVYVKNSINARLVVSNNEGIIVKCDDRLIPAIKIKQTGHKIVVGLDNDELKEIAGSRFWGGLSINRTDNYIKINGKRFNGNIEVIIFIKEVNEIKASSSADIAWEGSLPTNDLHIIASSSGDVSWDGLLEVDKLDIDCSSSGDVEGDYKGYEATVDLSSSGDYEGDMDLNNLEVEISSSADFKGDINVRNLNVDISSSGDYKGKVNAEKARFSMSSSGDAKVSGNIGYLNVHASSSSDFYGKKVVYRKAEVKTSSSANIFLSKSGELIDNTSKHTGVIVE